MKDFTNKRVKYNCTYADAMLAEFKKIRYGISSCCPKEDVDLITMRYELAEWQSSVDYSCLSNIENKCTNWLVFPVQESEECP
jgi:hypothetical protein